MNRLLGAGRILAIQLSPMERGRSRLVFETVRPNLAGESSGRMPALYYFIALLESIALLGFIVSLLKGEFFSGKPKLILKLALVFSLFVFIILAFGSRLTGKFDVAAINLLYFLGALISCREAAREEP